MAFRVSSALAAAGVLAMAGAADAFVFWSQPSGAGPFFTYSGGGSDNGFFGNPTVIGNQFQFLPAAFQAQSTNGVTAQMNDRLEVRLVANPGQRFTQIRIDEIGDWEIVGVGSGHAAGTMFLTDNINIRFPTTNVTPVQMTPSMPVATPAGIWQGVANRNLVTLPPDWTDITLILTNSLQATSQQGAASRIRKTGVTITVLPAPAGAVLLGLAGLVAARRRR